MKRTLLADLGALITISAASFLQFIEHAVPFLIAIVVGVLTIWEKWQSIQKNRRSRQAPPPQDGPQA